MRVFNAHQKERFEQSEHHVEYEGLVNYVDTLQTAGQASLHPLCHRPREVGGELRDLAQRQAVHVQ